MHAAPTQSRLVPSQVAPHCPFRTYCIKKPPCATRRLALRWTDTIRPGPQIGLINAVLDAPSMKARPASSSGEVACSRPIPCIPTALAPCPSAHTRPGRRRLATSMPHTSCPRPLSPTPPYHDPASPFVSFPELPRSPLTLRYRFRSSCRSAVIPHAFFRLILTAKRPLPTSTHHSSPPPSSPHLEAQGAVGGRQRPQRRLQLLVAHILPAEPVRRPRAPSARP